MTTAATSLRWGQQGTRGTRLINTGTNPRLRKRGLTSPRRVFFILLCAGLSFYIWPLFAPHSVQDRCTFGTSSTQLYDRLYSEAGEFLATHGLVRLRNRSGRASIEFNREIGLQFEKFVSSRETFVERIAALHALLRHYGMEFDSMWIQAPKLPLNDPRNRIFLNYFVYLPKLNWLCISCYILRTGEFKVHVNHNADGIYDHFASTLGRKSSLTGVWPFQYGRKHEVCPRDIPAN